MVPIVLHVDYRSYLGWKDPDAKRELSLRQRKLTPLQRLAFVHTPRVMLQGRDFRDWGTAGFDALLARINAAPARARIELRIVAAAHEAFTVRAIAEVSDKSQLNDAALYLASYENRLQGQVVLQWEGPLPLAGGKLVDERLLALVPGAVSAHSGVVAFVQNRRSNEVLQALALPACP